MSMMMSTKKQLLLSQVSVIIFSLAAGFLGRGGVRYWLFVIIYFAVYMFVMSKLSGSARKSKANVMEVEAGRVLFEEKESFEIMSLDREYQEEMMEQMKIMQTNLLMMFPIMIYFVLAYKPVVSHVPQLLGGGHLGYFLAYLILFEGSSGLSYLGQYMASLKLKRMGKKMVMINAPRAFKVTTEGIILQGVASKTALKFPITDYKIECNPKRNFVELVQETEKMVTKIRLYTKRAERLMEIIKRRNERALKRKEK